MFRAFLPKALTLVAAATLSACAGTRATQEIVQIVPTPVAPEVAADTNDSPVFVETTEKLSCVPFARERSSVQIWGDAYTWWDQALGLYARETSPRPGSVLVLDDYAGPKRAHLAVVTRIVSPREIRVDHANWLNDGNIYLNSPVIDVSVANDWSRVRVWNNRDGHLGANNYNVRGFITPIVLSPPSPPLS